MNPPPLNQVKETCLYVKDLMKTRSFYEGLLGLSVISYVEGRHIFFRVGNDVLLCFNPEDSRKKVDIPPHFGSGNLHFAFECPAGAYERWKAYAVEKGIEIEKEIEWSEGVRSFYFRDPDHHCVEILMPGLWD